MSLIRRCIRVATLLALSLALAGCEGNSSAVWEARDYLDETRSTDRVWQLGSRWGTFQTIAQTPTLTLRPPSASEMPYKSSGTQLDFDMCANVLADPDAEVFLVVDPDDDFDPLIAVSSVLTCQQVLVMEFKSDVSGIGIAYQGCNGSYVLWSLSTATPGNGARADATVPQVFADGRRGTLRLTDLGAGHKGFAIGAFGDSCAVNMERIEVEYR